MVSEEDPGVTRPSAGAIAELRAQLKGEVVLPGEPDYDTARNVWNGIIDKYPALVVRCLDVDDVIACVEFARISAIPLAIRGGGHSQAGHGTCDDGLVIDMSPMKEIRVDPETGTARVQGGVQWGELDEETMRFGLAVTGGQISSTGVAGLTLGGGVGWLHNKLGLTIDSLLSAEIVTADGEVLTASETENPDLFWGLRGGGGNFGVVTTFEFRLHPVGTVLGGIAIHDGQDAQSVLEFYQEFATASPDELTLMAILWTATLDPWVPQELRGKQLIGLAVCYAGDIEHGMQDLEPLRSFGNPLTDTIRPMPYTELQRLLDDTNLPGTPNYWKSGYLHDLTGEAIDTVVRYAYQMPSPLSKVLITNMKGAVRRVGEEETAFGDRDAPHYLEVLAKWEDPLSERHIAWANDTFEAMAEFSTGGTYVNFLGEEGQDRVRAAYGDRGNYERLTDLKTKYDPTNLFRLNQNIPPKIERTVS
jgi:FAD/FMN-containing dehydrogenase